MFDKYKAKKAEAEAERARLLEAASRAEMQRQYAFLHECLELAREFNGIVANEAEDVPISLRAKERVLAVVRPVALMEPCKAGGHWKGRSSGVSVRVPGTKTMRYRVGASRGQYVQGVEKPTPIDTGTLTITSGRAVFLGPSSTREWAWSKLLGVTHCDEPCWTAIGVSNRQKTSGFLYGEDVRDLVRFRLDLAVALAQGRRDELVVDLTDALSQARVELSGPDLGRPLPPPQAR